MKANHDLKQILKILWTLVKKPDWLPFAPPIKPSWSSKADVGDWLNNTPTLSEDGAHPYLSPFYFEWWYFDINFGESSALSVIFHLTDLFRPASSTGSINVSILSRGKKVYHRFVPYSRERIHASSEQCDVWIGENHCWEEKGIYYLRMSEQNLAIELQFTPSCVGWRPGNGKFIFGSQDVFFSWIVPLAKAKVNGWIRLNGVETLVNGVGYHDHNWGTVSLFDTFKDWTWGRIYLGDYTCIYADIQLSARYGGERIMPFALFYKKEVVASSFLDCNEPIDPLANFLEDPQMCDMPKGWTLRWQDNNERFCLQLHTRYVLEKADLLSGSSLKKWFIDRFVAHPFYIRCIATTRGTLTLNGQSREITGEAICEQMCMQRE